MQVECFELFDHFCSISFIDWEMKFVSNNIMNCPFKSAAMVNNIWNLDECEFLSLSCDGICVCIFIGFLLVVFIMFKSMATQIHWQSKFYIAPVASVDIVTDMSSNVFGQITFVGILSITMCACKRCEKEHIFLVWKKWITRAWVQ